MRVTSKSTMSINVAQKGMNSTKAVNEEVSDDEARVMEIMQILFRMRAGQMRSHQISPGKIFATLANNYNKLGSIQVNIGMISQLQ